MAAIFSSSSTFHVDDDVAPLKQNAPRTPAHWAGPFHVDDDVAPLKRDADVDEPAVEGLAFHVDDDVAPLKRDG